jgi:hypothetical protein
MNKAVAAVAGGVVVAVVVGVAAYQLMKDGKEERDLVLTGSGSSCTTTDPGALGNRKNKKIVWKIANNCSTAQYVQFRDFKRKHLDDDGYDPIDNSVVNPYPPGTSTPIAAGATVSVDTTITKGPKWVLIIDTYKYDVYLGTSVEGLTRVLDPDVEIWP